MHGLVLLLTVRTVWRSLFAGLVLGAASMGARADIIEWSDSWQLRLNGQQLSVRPFSTSLTPEAAVRELARQYKELRRFLVGGGRVLMSGMREGEHLLAEIHGSAGGAQGYVSTLNTTRSSGSPNPAPRLGQGPERIFDFGPTGILELTNGLEAPNGSVSEVADGRIIIPPAETGSLGVVLTLPGH